MRTASRTVLYLSIAALLFFGMSRWAIGEGKKGAADTPPLTIAETSGISFQTNSFTSPEQRDERKVAARAVPDDYALAAESEGLVLYATKDAQGFMVRDKRSGYVWSSSPDEQAIGQGQLNDEWSAALRSPFLVEYFDESAMQKRGSYSSLGGKTKQVKPMEGGIAATYELGSIGVAFTMEIKIESESLVVKIADRDIAEEGAAKLSAVQPFPFFGAVRKDEVPGYIFIPDGTGALIRFKGNHSLYDQAFDGRVYGMDEAVEDQEDLFVRREQPILMPVFGFVHGVRQNGFIGVMEEGKYNSRITASPSGLNTEYYWASPKFMLRYAYFQPTSKNMGGFNTYQRERDHEDRQVRYLFLSGQDADYAGMAKAYRNYLEKRGILSKKSGAPADIPLQIELLAADKEPGLAGNHLVKMTTFEQAGDILGTLRKDGIPNIAAVLKGWSKGGIYGSNPDKFPVPGALGGKKGLIALQQSLREQGIPLFLYSNYVTAFGSNGNFSSKTDGIRTAGNQVLRNYYRVWFDTKSSGDMDVYFMNPKKAAQIAEDDAERFEQMGVNAVALGNIGSLLFSDSNPKHNMTRQQTAAEYEKLSQTLLTRIDRAGYYSPFDYLWKYADQLFEMPMYSSQYMFATDTVPFLQIVLHGYREYFAPNFNYNASPKEYLLRMVEYGAYPSYDVMHEPSWKLKNTLSKDKFTSYFEDWRSDIKSTYDKLNAALRSVQTATIEQRNMVDWGVVEVVYSNGVKIVVNYRAKDVTYAGRAIPQMDFAVIGGE